MSSAPIRELVDIALSQNSQWSVTPHFYIGTSLASSPNHFYVGKVSTSASLEMVGLEGFNFAGWREPASMFHYINDNGEAFVFVGYRVFAPGFAPVPYVEPPAEAPLYDDLTISIINAQTSFGEVGYAITNGGSAPQSIFYTAPSGALPLPLSQFVGQLRANVVSQYGLVQY